MYNNKDLMGQKFGRLIVIRRNYPNNKWRNKMWLCRCECGEEKIIASNNLRRGNTKSCGCLQEEHFKYANEKRKLTFGLANMRALLRSYKASAKKRKLKWNLTEKQFAEITQRNCYYCGAEPDNKAGHKDYNGMYIYNGLDRINNNKDYIIDNVVSCCKTCNHAKGTLSLQEFKDWIKKIYQTFCLE